MITKILFLKSKLVIKKNKKMTENLYVDRLQKETLNHDKRVAVSNKDINEKDFKIVENESNQVMAQNIIEAKKEYEAVLVSLKNEKEEKITSLKLSFNTKKSNINKEWLKWCQTSTVMVNVTINNYITEPRRQEPINNYITEPRRQEPSAPYISDN